MKKTKFGIMILLFVGGCVTKQERSFDIVEYPSPVLLRECENVAIGDTEASLIFRELEKKLYEDESCVGLAAPQIGVSKKIVVIDIKEGGNHLYRLINPKIASHSKEMSFSPEGCASMPGVYANVLRYNSVIVEYMDHNFQTQSVKANGLLAFCLQHEIDHLHGKMFIDRLSASERAQIVKKYEKSHSLAKQKVKNQ